MEYIKCAQNTQLRNKTTLERDFMKLNEIPEAVKNLIFKTDEEQNNNRAESNSDSEYAKFRKEQNREFSRRNRAKK